ncbi:hypothetical protein ABIE89_005728 [Bradyrhizobium niftali]|uniref:hypothetical protein n=1 Tax=Bradyrhizobium niftali TaxID=2560055 RepID=UPI003834A2A2
MQMPMQVNDSNGFLLASVELPADLQHTHCGLYLDCLLDFAPAYFWLDMADAELKAALDHIHQELFSFRDRKELFSFCNLDRALDWLFGRPPHPPSVWTLRRSLRALVPISEAYWCRRIERKEMQRRDEDDDRNGAPTEADMVEFEEREGADDSCRAEESPAADSAAAFRRH